MNILKYVKKYIKEHKIKTILWSVSLVGVVASLILFNNLDIETISKKFTESKKQENVYTVNYGDVCKSIEKKGVVEPTNRYEITALVDGEIKNDYFDVDDVVEKGQLLYTIDSSELDSNIETAKMNIQSAQITYDESSQKCDELMVKSTANGVINKLYVHSGEQISEGTKVVDIVDRSKMILKVNFLTTDIKNISVGESANVEIVSTSKALNGRVLRIASGSIENDYGIPVTPVEILVDNPGTIKQNDKASAIIDEVSCNSYGEFFNYTETSVYSLSSGIVKNVNFSIGDKVKTRDIIIELENKNLEIQKQQNYITLSNAKITYENYIKQLENYNIKAPISGKIVQKNIKAGEKVSLTNSSSMAIIEDVSSMVFTIDVDELDVLSLNVGQTVTIIADAIENEQFTGYISNISTVAKTGDGISTYPVKIVINDVDKTKLLPGMNVKAVLEIASRENVLIIPSKAVKSGNQVLIINGTNKKGEHNSELKEIKTGINNGDFVEVISGLHKDDKIIVVSE